MQSHKEGINMNIQNISLSCCPKPKQSFNGAKISQDAMQAIARRIAKYPDEMDDFKAIGKLDVNIDLDKAYPSKVEFLLVEKKNDNSKHLATIVTSMGKLREQIERLFNN